MKTLSITALTLAMITAANAQIRNTDQGNTITYGQKTYPLGPQIAPRNPELYKPYSTISPYSPPSESRPSKSFDQNTNRPFGR
jgi:hypothetical protein